jgi:adenosine deaminase
MGKFSHKMQRISELLQKLQPQTRALDQIKQIMRQQQEFELSWLAKHQALEQELSRLQDEQDRWEIVHRSISAEIRFKQQEVMEKQKVVEEEMYNALQALVEQQKEQLREWIPGFGVSDVYDMWLLAPYVDAIQKKKPTLYSGSGGGK